MSRSLKKRKNHWTNKAHESVLSRNEDGELGLELKGGAEHGQFPVVGELLPATAACHGGKLIQDELLLEVNDTPVAGLTTRDVHAVVKHSKDPVRLKCVKPGESMTATFMDYKYLKRDFTMLQNTFLHVIKAAKEVCVKTGGAVDGCVKSFG